MRQSAPTGAAQTLPRVLVVDDEPLSIQGFQRSLRDHAEVVVASTFENARATLQRGEAYVAFVFDSWTTPARTRAARACAGLRGNDCRTRAAVGRRLRVPFSE
jgi:DNA-binding NarL/FixJ family response regulator